MTKNLQDFLITKEALTDISNIERKKFLQKIKIIKYIFAG